MIWVLLYLAYAAIILAALAKSATKTVADEPRLPAWVAPVIAIAGAALWPITIIYFFLTYTFHNDRSEL